MPTQKINELDILLAYQATSPSIQRKAETFRLFELLNSLKQDLASGDYEPQPYRCFAVLEPKVREIFAPSFRDRLVHHLIVDRLMPLLDKKLIFDSFANRPGKGAHAAVRRLQQFMRQSSSAAYYMKCDIAAYFTSIDRRILLGIIIWHINRLPELDTAERDFITKIVGKILDQRPAAHALCSGDPKLLASIPPHKSLFFTKPQVGMPIGSLTSQFFSNLYLNELDRFIKHQLKVSYYIRYVDDFILLSENPSQLHEWRKEIEVFLREKLALALHPRKTIMQPVHRGCDYLGYIVWPHGMSVRKRIVKAFRRRLYFFNHLLSPEKFPHFNPPPHSKWGREVRSGLLALPMKPSLGLLQNMLQVINSYFGTMAHADTYKLRRHIYFRDFHQLEKYFLPDKGFTKAILRPIARLREEGLIAM